jgi:hypothetical protein
VILSVHLADIGFRGVVGVLRGKPRPAGVTGLVYAETAVPVPLGGRVPRPQFGRVGMIAAWDDDGALDSFLASHPLAARLAGGFHVRLDPLRASGAWPAMPGLGQPEREVDDDEPVGVITLGNLRLRRAVPFLRTNRPAADLAAGDPGVLFATGMARPPHIVSTFSLWRTAAAMKAYAYGKNGPGHADAIKAQRKNDFHHQSVFARFRPYAPSGTIDGREDLAGWLAP